MKIVQATASSVRPPQATSRIEGWLLRGGVLVDEGVHEGGVAGWLDHDGKPEFVYAEAAGYYLTTMAWLASGTVSSPDHADTARRCSHRAAGWLANLLSGPGVLPTRLYLPEQRADWRNSGVFSFDLAMAARGLAVTRHAIGRHDRLKALSTLCGMLDRISSDADVMVSHESVAGSVTAIPDRWSTRPGPHHLKAAAVVLGMPERIVGTAMIGVAQRTCEQWSEALRADVWPCQELHAVLYGFEGMIIRAGAGDGDGLRDVEALFMRLMELQAPDGTLPEAVNGGVVRSDVLAQALRVGLILRGRGYLTGSIWTERLGLLTEALLGFVRPDGGVVFSHDQGVANSWCAMFAHQALYLRAREGAQEPVPPAAFELLV
jgi:hypothetical protein